jgi:hypothetical protein
MGVRNCLHVVWAFGDIGVVAISTKITSIKKRLATGEDIARNNNFSP